MKKWLILLAWVLGASVRADSIVNFDDLAADTHISGTSYQGLFWEQGSTGYGGNLGAWVVGTNHYKSAPYDVYNSWGATNIGISFGSTVFVKGAYLMAQGNPTSWTTGVRVHGYLDGVQTIVTPWFNSISAQPAWMQMNLLGVDRIMFETIPVNNGGGWFGMDDFTYVQVPEPGTLVLLAGGILAVGLACRRSQRR